MGPRSTSRSIDDDALVVGEIRGPHGIHGDVRVDPRTDVPDRFAPGSVLMCDGIGPLTVATVRGEKGDPIVLFDGIASRADAERLRGRLLRVARERSRQAIAPGSFLWADIIGAEVATPEGTQLGIVRDLLRAGGADVLIVATENGPDLLLPMVASVVRSVDVAGRRIVASPQEELS